jgi:sulfatase maturation enzyme AslB (radical SAM superfamily)
MVLANRENPDRRADFVHAGSLLWTTTAHHLHSALHAESYALTAQMMYSLPARSASQTSDTSNFQENACHFHNHDNIVLLEVVTEPSSSFTRKCNYECGFCFHTAKTSHVEPLDAAKKGLRVLKDARMRKINFVFFS